MKKFVKYIGESKDGFINGEIYELGAILHERNRISLSGINGLFIYDLFEEVEEPKKSKQTYIAFAKHRPKIGYDFSLSYIMNEKIEPTKIDKIIDISLLEGNLYRIETEKAVYITQIQRTTRVVHYTK